MKKFLTTLATVMLIALATFGLFACGGKSGDSGNGGNGGNDPEPPALSVFTGITLTDDTVTYDGAVHSLTVSGTLPEGTNVSYENNDKTNAGVYTVKATLKKDGYESKTLSATLTINKAQFTGITLEDKSFIYFKDKVFSLAVDGELPEGTKVSYENNDKTDVGEYDVKATITNPNYETLVLTAKLTVKAKTALAIDIINSLLNKPDPWAFLPEALTPEHMAYSQMPIGGLDGFATFTQTSAIAKKSIGKQFNVLYEGLCDAAAVISKMDTVYAVGTTIADVYQTYINNNPDDHAQFTGTAAGFKIKIILDDQKSVMLVGNASVNMELEFDAETETRIGRIQVTDGAAIKYTATPDSLKLAVQATIGGVGSLKQIEFARSGNAVVGYLREFTGTETKNLKTTGVIASDSQKTIIMSNKREREDLVINGYEEVYSSVTGEMIGGEVQETIAVVNYDTLWLHLADVQGINSVRVEDTANGLNEDSVYINGQSDVFGTKKVNPIIPTSSRRFDIEMKEVWYVVETVEDNKTEYKLQKTLIPMLFVQKEQVEDFPADVKDKNSYITSVALPAAKISTVTADFETLKTLFDAAKEQVTYDSIKAYIGEKNEFFAA